METNDSLERFAFEFTHFPEILPENRKKFLKWVYPLKEESFKNKIVLDAGCGNGRNSLWVLKIGAKKLVAFDNHQDTVSVAKKNLKEFKNAKVILNSIYKIPFNNEFDIVMCIGVLQHLGNPQTAISNLVKACKRKGKIVVWVYGKEGNGLITRFVNPIRSVTSRIPIILPYCISFILSIFLYYYLKFFKPNNRYLKFMSTYSFRLLFNIVFDHLIPKVANYWTKKALAGLFNKKEVKNIRICSVAGNSWTLVCERI